MTHGSTQAAHVGAPFKYAKTHDTEELVSVSKLVTADWRDFNPVSVKFGLRHSLRDGPAVISPPDAVGVDGGTVVVGGGVVVVVATAPLPPPLLLPTVAVDVVVAGGAVGEIEKTVNQPFKSSENRLLLDSDASGKTTSERTEFKPPPPNADAEASMFTIATRTQDETASVMILGRLCAVFARKKFLDEPLRMQYKFAVSYQTPTYKVSTLPQFSLMLPM